MGYIAQWDDFSVSAERMFLSSPLQTRISLKYRATDGVFVVKVTDNQKALLFKSNQKADLRKMEALNMRLLDLMTAASATDVDALPDEQKESSTIDSSKPKKLT